MKDQFFLKIWGKIWGWGNLYWSLSEILRPTKRNLAHNTKRLPLVSLTNDSKPINWTKRSPGKFLYFSHNFVHCFATSEIVDEWVSEWEVQWNEYQWRTRQRNIILKKFQHPSIFDENLILQKLKFFAFFHSFLLRINYQTVIEFLKMGGSVKNTRQNMAIRKYIAQSWYSFHFLLRKKCRQNLFKYWSEFWNFFDR